VGQGEDPEFKPQYWKKKKKQDKQIPVIIGISFVCVCVCEVLGLDPRALRMLGKCSASELCPQP
jgi:hypothetical protein